MKESFKMVTRKHENTSGCDLNLFSKESANKIREFHKSFPVYAPTPLAHLNKTAECLGLKDVYVKDESWRFGLNAFKVLGGSYAIGNYLAERLGKDISEVNYETLVSDETRKELGDITFVTATDGNHGRGVAWEGYEDILTWIMQGYGTMGLEAQEQLPEKPTYIFLQAGVGSMAGAVTGLFSAIYGKDRPVITIVEPNKADCLYRIAEANDGERHFVTGDMNTIMAGLACGEPCSIGWKILADYADHFISCPDYVAAKGMRILGNPVKGDDRVASEKVVIQYPSCILL